MYSAVSDFLFNDAAPTEIYTLSLHDALPICPRSPPSPATRSPAGSSWPSGAICACWRRTDRKSTRLNSSHMSISYAVFCLKKKKKVLNRDHIHNHVDTQPTALPSLYLPLVTV